MPKRRCGCGEWWWLLWPLLLPSTRLRPGPKPLDAGFFSVCNLPGIEHEHSVYHLPGHGHARVWLMPGLDPRCSDRRPPAPGTADPEPPPDPDCPFPLPSLPEHLSDLIQDEFLDQLCQTVHRRLRRRCPALQRLQEAMDWAERRHLVRLVGAFQREAPFGNVSALQGVSPTFDWMGELMGLLYNEDLPADYATFFRLLETTGLVGRETFREDHMHSVVTEAVFRVLNEAEYEGLRRRAPSLLDLWAGLRGSEGPALLEWLASVAGTQDIQLAKYAKFLPTEEEVKRPKCGERQHFFPDILLHSPEARLRLNLSLLAVSQDHVRGTDFALWSDTILPEILGEAQHSLLRAELDSLPKEPAPWFVFPVHPLNVDQINWFFASLKSSGRIVWLNSTRIPAAPTMSVRTVEPWSLTSAPSRYQLKLPVPISLLNYARSLAPEEVLRGPAASEALRDLVAEDPLLGGLLDSSRELCGFHVRFQPANWTQYENASFFDFLVRESPYSLAQEGELILPLAGLFAESPWTGKPLAAELLHRAGVRRGDSAGASDYFRHYAGLTTRALLGVAALYGVAPEAHQQNAMLVFEAESGRLKRLVVKEAVEGPIVPHQLMDREARQLPPPLHPLVDERGFLAQQLNDSSLLRPLDPFHKYLEKIAAVTYQMLLIENLLPLAKVLEVEFGCEPALLKATIREAMAEVFDYARTKHSVPHPQSLHRHLDALERRLLRDEVVPIKAYLHKQLTKKRFDHGGLDPLIPGYNLLLT